MYTKVLLCVYESLLHSRMILPHQEPCCAPLYNQSQNQQKTFRKGITTDKDEVKIKMYKHNEIKILHAKKKKILIYFADVEGGFTEGANDFNRT